MSITNVFREGSSWRYSLKNVVSPERYDTKDEAQFAAEQAAVKLLKDQEAKAQESQPKEARPKEEKTVTKDLTAK
jgi:hypothetical protein